MSVAPMSAGDLFAVRDAVKSLVLVASFAVGTVLLADALFHHVVHIPQAEYETYEALRDYARSDPHVLVLGSSYARSFLPLADWYAKQPVQVRMNVVPIEGGKFYAYAWLLERRLAPLIDEKDAHGKPARPSLSHLVLVTNYWDVCSSSEPYPNLPSRAWTLGDYLADLAREGATPYNQNYVDQRWNELAAFSSLVRDRGVSRILRTLRERISPKSQEQLEHDQASQLEAWIAMIEGNDLEHPGCFPQEQDAALERMLKFAHARKLSVTLVLWPVIPKAQTERVLAVTERFKRYVERAAGVYGARIVDLQADGVLLDEDFRKDLDHLEPWGEEKVLAWALKGPFAKFETHKPAALGARPSE